MRIHNCCSFEVFVNGLPSSFYVGSLHFQLDLSSMWAEPVPNFVFQDFGFIRAGIDHKLIIMGRFIGSGFGENFRMSACSHLGIKYGCRNPYSLLSPALLESMEPGAIEKFCKNFWNLLFYNSGPIIFYNYGYVVLSCSLNLDKNIRQNTCLFAGIQRVVKSFFYSCYKASRSRIKTQDLPVFFEKFCNTY